MQILTAFALLIPAFSLLYTPQPLALLFHRVYNAPLPNTLLYCLSFGVRLSGKRCEDTQTTRMLAQKQPLIQRVRNSSLVERLCAENLTGLNLTPKLRQYSNVLGRGALYTRRNSSASGSETSYVSLCLTLLVVTESLPSVHRLRR